MNKLLVLTCSNDEKFSHTFTTTGGSIGYSDACDFDLIECKDMQPGVVAIISEHNNAFFMHSNSDDRIALGNSNAFVQLDHMKPLSDGDQLFIDGKAFAVTLAQSNIEQNNNKQPRADGNAWYEKAPINAGHNLTNSPMYDTPSMLVASLLKGMNVSIPPEQITPHSMTLIGQALHVSLTSLWCQHQQLCAEKASAHFYNDIASQQPELTFDNDLSVWLHRLVNPRDETQSALPQQLKKDATLVQQVTQSLLGIQADALSELKQHLSPEHTIADYQQQHQTRRTASLWRRWFLWPFHQKTWAQRCDNFLQDLKKTIEERLLAMYAKHHRDRNDHA